jgi:hypothetical protein
MPTIMSFARGSTSVGFLFDASSPIHSLPPAQQRAVLRDIFQQLFNGHGFQALRNEFLIGLDASNNPVNTTQELLDQQLDPVNLVRSAGGLPALSAASALEGGYCKRIGPFIICCDMVALNRDDTGAQLQITSSVVSPSITAAIVAECGMEVSHVLAAGAESEALAAGGGGG